MEGVKEREYVNLCYGGACSVIVIVVGNGHGDPSSNLGPGCLHFILA